MKNIIYYHKKYIKYLIISKKIFCIIKYEILFEIYIIIENILI